MKVKVYPEGDSRSALEFELRPEAAVKAYLRHLDSDADVTNICVDPLDNEARSIGDWHEPDEPDGLPFKMFRVEPTVVVTWTVEEVDTFRTPAKEGA